MSKVELFYDLGSPYSYLAATRVEAVAQDCGARVEWRPMLLGGLFKAAGNTMPALVPAKARYMLTDLQRWARYYGVPFRMPSRFPLNTLLPMRVLAGLPHDRRAEASLALFHAYWAEDRDISDPEVIAALVCPEAVARAQVQEVKDALRANTEEALARGAFGAPTFFVDGELYFGNDRLPFVEQRLRELCG